MSLLPPAMKITDPIPMTLGAAVKKALSQATPVDSIRAFEVGDHSLTFSQRNGHKPIPQAKFDPPVWRLINYTGDGMVGFKREPTFIELTEAMRQHIGECCTEAIQADEPRPRFTVGDRVQWRADTLRDFGLKQEQWVINHIEGRRLFCSDGTHVSPKTSNSSPPPSKKAGGSIGRPAKMRPHQSQQERWSMSDLQTATSAAASGQRGGIGGFLTAPTSASRLTA